MHASEQGRVDSREDEEDGEGREKGEELRPFTERSDEKRLDSPGDAADNEVDRDFGEEYAEAKRPHEERDEETRATREHAGSEPVPGEAPDERPEFPPSLGHARARPRRSLEPMPGEALRDQFFN